MPGGDLQLPGRGKVADRDCPRRGHALPGPKEPAVTGRSRR